jgi:acyl transferase domain-containing protein
MDGLREELESSLKGLRARGPLLPLYSTTTGGLLSTAPTGAYWWRNLREPVRFAQAVRLAAEAGHRRFLEIGPAPILCSYLRDIFRLRQEDAWISPTLARDKGDPKLLENAWQSAWQAGWPLDMKKHFPVGHIRRPLPSYPWEREYCWMEESPQSRGFLRAERLHPLLGWRLPGQVPVFENVLLPADIPWLRDHAVGRGAVYPAMAFLESMLAAAAELFPDQEGLELERVTFFRHLPLADESPANLRLTVDMEDGAIVVESRPYMSPDPWRALARTRILPGMRTPPEPAADMDLTRGAAIDGRHLYRKAERFLFKYGPAFQTVEKGWTSPDRPGEVLVLLRNPDPASAGGMLVPPPLADGALQSFFLLLKGGDAEVALLPAAFEKVVLYSRACPRYAHARLERVSPRSVSATFRLLDENGRVLLLLSGCRFRRALWLEREYPPSRPYAQRLIPLPHPRDVYPPDFAGGEFDSMIRDAGDALAAGMSARDLQSRGILRITATAFARETADWAGGLSGDGRLLSDGAWIAALRERLADPPAAGDGAVKADAATLWRTLVATCPDLLPEAGLLSHVFGSRDKIAADRKSVV